MKIRFPLYAQILSFLFLHLTLLTVLFLILFNSQIGLGWEALVNSPIGDRLEAVAWVIHQQTRSMPSSTWNSTLDEFGKYYGVKFYLFDNHGLEVAGEPTALPDIVSQKVKTRHLRPPIESAASTAEINRALSSHTVPPVVTDLRGPGGRPFGRPHGRFLLHTKNPDTYWIGVRFPMRELKDGPATLLAAAPNLWQTRLFLDFGLFLAAIGGILVLSVVIWWPFVYSVTRSLADLTSATEKIAEGEFETSLKVARADEIGRLGEAVNSMAGRLNDFVTGQKRFLGDIAHELCSPVARLRMALELLENSATAKQESIIKDVREEVEEMTSLINELLAFSKAGLQGKETQLVPVEIEPVLRAAIEKACPHNSIEVDIEKDISALADGLLLERALTNILRNSVRYAGSEGPISVTAAYNERDAVLTLADCGPGVPPEAIKRLGQPFYRPEPSRNRSSGGVGLGLAIVKTCVEACDGTFSVRNRHPKGLEVEIRLKQSEGSNSQS